MKRRIIAIVAVVVLLITTLSVCVSAAQRPSMKDYYTWSYKYARYGWSLTYPDNIQYSVKVPFYFLGFKDNLTNSGGDFAERTYYVDFADKISQDVPYISSSTFDKLDVTESFIYYEEGWQNFAYKTKFEQSMDDANTVTAYDPFTDFGYTSYTIYNYIRRVDDTENIGGVTEVLREVTNTDLPNQYAYGYEFTLSGIYEVKSLIAFFNADTLEYRTFVGDTYTVNVGETTPSENEMYQLGYNNGYNVGYNKGYYDGIATEEKWTVLSLINAIIEAPFTFIDNAFSFTVFGVNVANAIRVVFTIGIIAMLAVVIFKVFI